MSELPGGTVTFLLTDIEGSLAHWQARPAQTATAVERHDCLVASAVAGHGGVVVKSRGEGDSTFSVFSRASDAVAAATTLQDSLRKALPGVRVRAAVHTGEADPRDGDYFGAAPSRCARLRDLAHGEQVLVSEVTATLLGHRGLTDVGTHRLRGFTAAERVFQVGVESFPPLRSGAGNLPAPLTSFVGRTDDVAALRDLLGERRLLTLTGPGGCGKSRLALEVCRDAAAIDGAWLVDLAPVGDPSLVAPVLAEVLGVRESPALGWLDAVSLLLRDRDAFVVLDNCEHLVDACAHVAERLVRECPSVRIVATSREPLGVAGECVWRVPPLSVDDGAALFVARATPGTDRSAEVEEICSRLDGMPLAIELAAARTNLLSPANILDGLADRFHLLTGGSRTALSRQKTLEASVEWSWSLLTEPEQTTLRRVAVFPGGFTLETAAPVVGSDDVLDVVSRLVDRSLVVSDGRGRFRLLDTIRHYALGRLAESGEIDEIRTRHRDMVLALIDGPADLDERCRRSFVTSVAAEDQNVLAAIDWCDTLADPVTALRIAAGAWTGWDTRAVFGDKGERLQTALDRAPDAPAAVRALALTARATILLQRRGPAEAAGPAAEAIEAAIEAGADDLEALARARLGFTLLYHDIEAARREIAVAERIAREGTSAAALVAALYVRGILDYEWGDPRVGAATLEEALARSRGADSYEANFILSRLSAAVVISGDLERGWAVALEGESHRHEMVDAVDRVMIPLAFAAVELSRGDLAAVDVRLDETEADVRSLSPWITPVVKWVRSQVALRRGDAEAALRLVADASTASSVWLPIECRVELAMALDVLGRDEEARGLLEDSIRMARGIGHPRSLVRGLRQLAVLERHAGNLDRADTLIAEAIERASSLHLRRQLIEALITGGGIRLDRGDLDGGGRLIGAAIADRDAMGLWLAPVDAPHLEDDLAMVSDLAAFAEGLALSPADAAAYALRGRSRKARTRSGWDSLTPAERDVVKLVAEGLTSPMIGERLFISPRTVQSHLSSVFAKLGVRTRTELTAQVARRSSRDT